MWSLKIHISLGRFLVTEEELEIYSNHILDTVSSNVKKYREEKNYTQLKLALEIGRDCNKFCVST